MTSETRLQPWWPDTTTEDATQVPAPTGARPSVLGLLLTVLAALGAGGLWTHPLAGDVLHLGAAQMTAVGCLAFALLAAGGGALRPRRCLVVRHARHQSYRDRHYDTLGCGFGDRRFDRPAHLAQDGR